MSRMNTICNDDVVSWSDVFYMVKHREIRKDDVEDASLLQQIAFLFYEMNLVKGKEGAGFYLSAYGPFAVSLCKPDSKVVVTNAEEWEPFCELLRGILSSTVSCPQYRWAEVIGTLFYLRKYTYPSLPEEEVLRIAEKKYLDKANHEDNQRAMEIVNGVLL